MIPLGMQQNIHFHQLQYYRYTLVLVFTMELFHLRFTDSLKICPGPSTTEGVCLSNGLAYQVTLSESETPTVQHFVESTTEGIHRGRGNTRYIQDTQNMRT